MRNDLEQSLGRSHIEPSALSTFQRILLTTDGTVTDILEAYLFEQIRLVKLAENIVSINNEMADRELKEGTEVIERKILLQGRISRRNYIYAESNIVLERLDEKLRDELTKTQTPMGKIWLEQRLETFKEIIDSGKESANGLAEYFQINPSDNLLFRTYWVFLNRRASIRITEKFPETYFVQKM